MGKNFASGVKHESLAVIIPFVGFVSNGNWYMSIRCFTFIVIGLDISNDCGNYIVKLVFRRDLGNLDANRVCKNVVFYQLDID